MKVLEFKTVLHKDVELYYKEYIKRENLESPLYSWEYYVLLFEESLKLAGEESKTYIVLEGEEILGIITLFPDNVGSFPMTDLFPAQVLTIKPERLQDFVSVIPQAFTFDDVAFPYCDKVNEDYWFYIEANIAELDDSLETYFMTIKKKSRSNFRRSLKQNNHLVVKNKWDEDAWKYLAKQWDKLWEKRGEPFAVAKNKMIKNILDWLTRKGVDTQPLFVYDKDKPISANRSIIENDHLRDIVCVRDNSINGIGIFTILKNMELAITKDIKYYDLGSQITTYKYTAYKSKFANTDKEIICGASIKQLIKPPYFDIDLGEWIL